LALTRVCEITLTAVFDFDVEIMSLYKTGRSSWRRTQSRWKVDWRSWRLPWAVRRLRGSEDDIYLNIKLTLMWWCTDAD